jgi:basic membrane protein A
MKNLKLVFLCIISVLLLLGCDNRDAKFYDVGMVSTFSGFDDLAFNYHAKLGLAQAAEDFTIDDYYREPNVSTSYQTSIELLASENMDLIFTIGFEQMAPTASVALEYPTTRFCIIDQELALPTRDGGVSSIFFHSDQAAFPLGYLAAHWAWMHDPSDAKTGAILGKELPVYQRMAGAFALGVAYYNLQYGRDVEALQIVADELYNPTIGQQKADSLLAMGADVIFPAAGASSEGAVQATYLAERWIIGGEFDFYYAYQVFGEICLSSLVKAVDEMVYQAAEDLYHGDYDDQLVRIGDLANGGVQLAPYHDFETVIPDSTQLQIISIMDAIEQGTIDTGW